MSDPRRRIPPVDQLLDSPALAALLDAWGRTRVTDALRAIQSELRVALDGSAAAPPRLEDPAWYAERAEEHLRLAARPALRRVINATGVVIHTNLGRAPLAGAARRAVLEAAGYTALEIDMESGGRGSRHDHCVDLLRELTGAESALVVNNNAAAVVLAVNTLASGREVVVSRGELVEIGGSFRVPEIIERSGATLREVGSTNRTHPADYETAIGPRTGAILRVHRSNFRVEGFTAEVATDDLARIAGAAGVPLVNDAGSGLVVDLAPFGIHGEPTVGQALEEGADLVTMSGDKLLGGPQAGIILGGAALVDRLRANPLSRALRPDKLTLAALAATLDLYRDPEQAFEAIPVLEMLTASAEDLRPQAEALAAALVRGGAEVVLAEGVSAVGGGALPGVELATTVVVVSPGVEGADAAARRLRLGDPPVVARVRENRLVLDPRTVRPEDGDLLVEAVVAAVLPGAGLGA